MIQSYKQNPTLHDHYDVIIIGSGMGSLTTGAILAKEGQKVLILEKHYTAGGFTHIFKRKGYEWDVGIHYIGEVQRENSAIRKLFDYISDGELKWADMGEVYDRIVIGDRQYDFVKGVTNWTEKIISYFPDEKQAIEQYVDLIFKATKTSMKFYMDKAVPPIVSKMAGGMMRKPFYKYSDKTTYSVIRELTDNEELIKVLTAQYGDYGLPPKQSSFAMHAAVVRHYFSGGSFPIGGSSQIVDTIDPIIERAGGSILISAGVKEILIKENKAIGVKMMDDKEIHGSNIISGAGILNTYLKLLPEANKNDDLIQPLKNLKRSVSHSCLYIGLNGSPEELELPKLITGSIPAILLTMIPVSNDISMILIKNCPLYIYRSLLPKIQIGRIDILVKVQSTSSPWYPFETFAKWEGSRWMKRGDEYDALKEKISQRLLSALYKHIPQTKGKVDHYELSSPLTTQNFVNYDKGEIYGLDHTPKRFRQKFLQPRTPIKNLYLTGQDIVTAGVGGALFSGVLTTSAVTGKNIMKKVMK